MRPHAAGSFLLAIAPDWSHDGFTDRVHVLAGHLQVFSIDSAVVGPPVRLTTGAANGKPSWSPDGRHIAVISLRDGDQEIHVMGPDGSDPVDPTNPPARDIMPAWSPDGSRIAFASDRDGDREIHVMGAAHRARASLMPAAHAPAAILSTVPPLVGLATVAGRTRDTP